VHPLFFFLFRKNKFPRLFSVWVFSKKTKIPCIFCWAPCRTIRIGSKFWKFYLIKTVFTLGEPVLLVKVFRLFRSEPIFLVFRVWTQCTTSYCFSQLSFWQNFLFKN
jgi:hypothetical protein